MPETAGFNKDHVECWMPWFNSICSTHGLSPHETISVGTENQVKASHKRIHITFGCWKRQSVLMVLQGQPHLDVGF